MLVTIRASCGPDRRSDGDSAMPMTDPLADVRELDAEARRRFAARDHDGAVSVSTEAVAHCEAVDPSVPDRSVTLGILLGNIGGAEALTGRRSRGIEHTRRAVGLLRDLAADRPRLRASLGYAHTALAYAQPRRRRHWSSFVRSRKPSRYSARRT